MDINAALTWILEVVASVDPVLRTTLAGLGMFLETSVLVGLVVPGDSIVIVASTAVETPVGYVSLLVAVIVGALGGESVGFALGRLFGPRIRDSRLGHWIGRANWQRAEDYVDRRGGPAVFISRFLPVFHSLVPLTVGMSAMSYRRFFAWTAPACVVWAAAYVTFGSVAAVGYRELADQLHIAGYIFVGVIVAFALGVVLVKWLLVRSERRHWDHPGDGDANTIDDDLTAR